MLKETGQSWWQDEGPRHGAALAFYSILSLGPLLLICLSVAGLVFGREAAHSHLLAGLESMLGQDGAQALRELLRNSAAEEEKGLAAAALGLAVLVFGASNVFAQLQTTLNRIWRVGPPQGHGILRLVRDRFMSFAMVLGTGFLLLVSLVLTSLLAALGSWFSGRLPSLAPALELLHGAIAFAVAALLFAMIFKILPDIRIAWRDVWTGAALTALLFTIGKWAIGFYLGHTAVASAYGAAGSIVVILVWVYYSAQILFLGAEFTRIRAGLRQQDA